MRSRRLTLILLPLIILPTAGAETVYKSVDEQGNVTYSSTPPPGGAEVVEQVPIAPPPPQSEVQAAEERMRQLEIESARSDRERRESKEQQTQSVAAAEAELTKARAELEDAKIQGDDDWQYLAAGGRVLKQSYLDRVERAEKRVQAAEDALRKARSGRP
jgi:hypothetical protein